jgi:hypothetical protein
MTILMGVIRKMENKLNELKELMEKRYNRSFTEEEVKLQCVSIIHHGVFKKGWKLNGVKHDEIKQ